MKAILFSTLSFFTFSVLIAEDLSPNKYGLTPVHYAAQKRDVSKLKELLDSGADPNIRGTTEWTPLLSAVVVGNLEAIKVLLAAGGDVNAKNVYGSIPLHHSTYDVALLLLESGADVNAVSKKGWTPLHSAAFFGRTKTVQLLLDRGAKHDVQNSDGHTPLQLAQQKKKKEVISLLSKLD